MGVLDKTFKGLQFRFETLEGDGIILFTQAIPASIYMVWRPRRGLMRATGLALRSGMAKVR